MAHTINYHKNYYNCSVGNRIFLVIFKQHTKSNMSIQTMLKVHFFSWISSHALFLLKSSGERHIFLVPRTHGVSQPYRYQVVCQHWN